MFSTYTNRIAAFTVAVVMTVAVNGAMLWKFDSVSKEAAAAHAAELPMQVTLKTVNILGHRS
jgi:hypothetical protein